MAEITLGTLYDFNKAAYVDAKPLDIIALRVNIAKIESKTKESKYWMLLSNERKDYTVFALTKNKNIFSKELEETLNNRGEVLDINELEDGNFEIWVRDPATKEIFVYYFFDYCYGVIEV